MDLRNLSAKGRIVLSVERTLQFSSELVAREKLLVSRGLSIPGREDLILGIFDDERMIATGSLVGDVVEGVAVDAGREGEGLSSQVVGSLIQRAGEKGIWHLFLFTKPREASLFKDLGFSSIASTAEAVLLEWGRPDVEDYKSDLRRQAGEALPDVSCVVVNCNPFTRGHRHLVETASSQSAHLFILVVEEDRSVFPFDVRYRLIREGTADFSNVTVLKGGRYIVSSATFPSYFTHEERHAAVHAALDVELFARHIAPPLGVSRRFVGQEPFSPVTDIYNRAMKTALPGYGIDLVEISRLEANGQAISASRVRRLIAEGRLDDVQPLVPAVTWRYLMSEESRPVRAKIRIPAGG